MKTDSTHALTLDELYFVPVPRFLRTGTLLFLATLFCGLVLAVIISYHDVVIARVRLVQVPPSTTLFCKASGRATLLVEDHAIVEPEQYLAVLENPARLHDVLILKRLLKEPDDAAVLCDIPLPEPGLSLGQLQDLYARFESDLLAYRLLTRARFHRNRLKLAERKLQLALSAVQTLQAQEETVRENFAVALRQIQNDSLLFMKGYMSVTELRAHVMELLQKKQSLQAARSSILLQESQVEELQREVYEETYQLSEGEKRSAQSVVASFTALKAGFRAWEENWVIRSPIKGKVSFVRLLDSNGYFKVNDEICTVIPQQGELFGRVVLEPFASGKIAAGQSGRIKCDNYPYQEFGTLHATVHSIAIAPHEGAYLVLVDLPRGLETDRGKELSFMEGMQGMIEITTARRTLFQRLLDPVASIIHTTIMQ